MSYLPRLFGSVLAAAALLGASAIFAEDATTKTYPSYHAAAAALIAAVAAKDEAAEKEILGANALELLSSGDSTADEDSRLSFLKHYREAHGFVRETPDR